MTDVTKLNLRLPAAMREEASMLAQAQGLSLNAYLLRAVTNANQFWGPKLVKQKCERDRVASILQLAPARQPDDQAVPKVGANQLCPCGSGQKYKRCHGQP